jgi:hypothetical protein
VSVKLLDNEAFYGYRVRRTVNGKLYQEYYSLKKAGKRLGPRLRRAVEVEAGERDQVLSEEQKRVKKQLKASRCFNANGSVKGISYLLKTEKSGTVTPIFQVGIASELESKIVCTSFSLNAHGKDLAWDKAVEAYAKHKIIGKNSKLFKKLMDSMPKVKAVKKGAGKIALAPKKKTAAAKSKSVSVKKKLVAVKPKATVVRLGKKAKKK